jgi:hypothetical protein
MKNLPLQTLLLLAAANVATAAVTIEFTSTEGYTEGVTINGVGNWNSQANWVARDVAGAGNAFSAVDFHRATLSNSNTFGVGDSYTLVAELTLINPGSVNTKTTMFQFGLTDTANPGSGNQPMVGMSVRPAFLNYFIDANNSVLGNEVNTGVAKDSNTHTYTTVITKSAVADTFDVTIDFDNGTASTSFTIVDSALYAASTVYPIIGNYLANNKGGIQLDSFSSTYTAVPEPATIAFLMGIAALGVVVYRRRKLEQ